MDKYMKRSPQITMLARTLAQSNRKRSSMRTLYAVWIEKDTGEFDYVRETNNGSWTDHSPVLQFDSKDDAEIEAYKWNTGRVVEYVRQQPTT